MSDALFNGPEELIAEAVKNGLVAMTDLEGLKLCDPRDVRIISMKAIGSSERTVLMYKICDYKEYIRFLLEVIKNSLEKDELMFSAEEIGLCLNQIEKSNKPEDAVLRSVLINAATRLSKNDGITDKDIELISNAKTVEDLLK